MPSIISIKKNNSDQRVEIGSVAIACGYTSNTKLGPTTYTAHRVICLLTYCQWNAKLVVSMQCPRTFFKSLQVLVTPSHGWSLVADAPFRQPSLSITHPHSQEFINKVFIIFWKWLPDLTGMFLHAYKFVSVLTRQTVQNSRSELEL